MQLQLDIYPGSNGAEPKCSHRGKKYDGFLTGSVGQTYASSARVRLDSGPSGGKKITKRHYTSSSAPNPVPERRKSLVRRREVGQRRRSTNPRATAGRHRTKPRLGRG